MKAVRWIVAWPDDREHDGYHVRLYGTATEAKKDAAASPKLPTVLAQRIEIDLPDLPPQPGEVWVSNHGHGQPLVVAGMVDGIVVGRWQLGSGPGHPCAWTLDEFHRFCARKAAS